MFCIRYHAGRVGITETAQQDGQLATGVTAAMSFADLQI